jgi:hypothetical protein
MGYFALQAADPTGKHLVDTGELTCDGEKILVDLHTGKLYVEDPNGMALARYPGRDFREVKDTDAFIHCRPEDDRHVHDRYCDSWREGGKVNKWTQCACQVSRSIDALLLGLTAHAILGGMGHDDMNTEEAVAKIHWFTCTRSCLVLKWQDADDSYFGRVPKRPPTSDWQEFLEKCKGDHVSSKECCRIQVKAEQTTLNNCMKLCGRWRWGNPSGSHEMTGWGRHWDFNDLETRINFGNWRCCGDDNPDGRTPKCTLIGW